MFRRFLLVGSVWFGVAGNPLCLQDIIFRLQEFWAERGCAVLSPYNSEVGAGTFNPATFIRQRLFSKKSLTTICADCFLKTGCV